MAQIPSADLPVVNKDTGRINLEWYAALQRLVSEIAALGVGGVTSFEGRAGVVVGVAGDYTAAEVTNAPAGNIAAVTVQAAIDELDTEKQPLDADLTALAALASTGLVARTGAATYAARTVTGSANEITVADGGGVAGNPTLSLPATIDLGGKTSLEIPNSAAPTVDADGEIAVDTTVADFSHGVLKYFGGEELGVVAMPIAQFASPVDGRVPAYNAAADEFQLVAGSGLVFLTSGTVSAAATLDLVLTSYTAYRGVVIKLSGFLPATDGADFWIRFSTNGGSSYDATGYNYAANARNDAGTGFGAASGSANQLLAAFTVGNASNEGLDGSFELLNQTSAAFWSRLNYRLYMIDNSATPVANCYQGGGSRETAQDTDAVRFMFSTGNVAAGNYAVYGLL